MKLTDIVLLDFFKLKSIGKVYCGRDTSNHKIAKPRIGSVGAIAGLDVGTWRESKDVVVSCLFKSIVKSHRGCDRHVQTFKTANRGC